MSTTASVPTATVPTISVVQHEEDEDDDDDDVPESVLEAGALLGAAITKCNMTQHCTLPPPPGMHSSFSTLSPVPSSELFCRLYQLRSLLKSSTGKAEDVHIITSYAPSLLAVLMKLLGVSSSLAAQFVHDCRVMTPPLWSTPIRRLWVDCVVLCHALGSKSGMSGSGGVGGSSSMSSSSSSNNNNNNKTIDVFAFLRNMVALAGLNPKSLKAAGGTRMAALQVIGGMFQQMPMKLSPWALDVLQLCHRSLKSSGNGEPSYRMAAVMDAACCVVQACRDAKLEQQQERMRNSTRSTSSTTTNPLLLQGAMEDLALTETFRLMKLAITDKYPEVRMGAAKVASIVAPMMILSKGPSNKDSGGPGAGIGGGPAGAAGGPSGVGVGVGPAGPSSIFFKTALLEEMITLATKCLDDERAGVAVQWAEAMSRLLTTCIEYGKQLKFTTDSTSRRRTTDDGDEDEGSTTKSSSSSSSSRGVKPQVATICTSLPSTVKYLVEQFIKAGGELAASRMGGPFSTGGRAVRMGWGLVLTKLLRFQSTLGNVYEEYGIPHVLRDVLAMVGPDVQKQLHSNNSNSESTGVGLESGGGSGGTSSSTNLFGTRRWSPADAGLVRLATNRVLREGLAEMASEPTQLKLLQELMTLLLSTTSIDLNSNQMQVVLVELSHLLTTLGEAAGNALSELVPILLGQQQQDQQQQQQGPASPIGSNIPACLANSHHGVRHEAAIVCASIAIPFPTIGRIIYIKAMEQIQFQHAELVTLASMQEAKGITSPMDIVAASQKRTMSRFIRGGSDASRNNNNIVSQDASLKHQFAIHGNALTIAILLRELPHLNGGLPHSDLMDMALSVAEILITCQYMTLLTSRNPSGACTCVRAGYGILCGVLSVGATSSTTTTTTTTNNEHDDDDANNNNNCGGGNNTNVRLLAKHMPVLFDLWTRSCESAKMGSIPNFTVDHDLMCLDATVASIVAFLEHCPALLLEVPDALSKTTMLLEQMLGLFLDGGRLSTTIPSNNNKSSSGATASRYESAKSSLLEAFAWLPPGSFPMVANKVFAFALQHIQSLTEAEVTCSILSTLINNEDKVLDTKSLVRAQRYWEVGGSRAIGDHLLMSTSEVAHHGERESVLHFQSGCLKRRRQRSSSCSSRSTIQQQQEQRRFRQSQVLGIWATTMDQEDDEQPPPTPLHAVGTWKKPVSPSFSSKVRLIDAAIHAFSATFGLKDGKEQQQAMQLLESLVPPLMMQVAKAIGVVTKTTSEMTDRGRNKGVGGYLSNKDPELNAAIANITAVLLACLKALPLHEATHDVPIGLGPPWMNSAKDLLLALLPSASNIVRRAASEGLALLATLGVSEDAHTLQSTVLHSLDEVMQGNTPDGKPRAMALEPVTVARAGSLLTLGCIQRTAYNIEKKQQARHSGRRSSKLDGGGDDEALPTIQMMTRILPSIACHAAIRDAFVVRTYAMHAFILLIAYSSTLKRRTPTIQDKQLIRKALEVVEDNFLACWTAVSATMDKGQEPGKLAAEAKFVAVILRTMSFLLPNIRLVMDDGDNKKNNPASSFSRIATVILEEQGSHPIVMTEALAFFELLSGHQHLLPTSNKNKKKKATENPLTCCVPFLMESMQPAKPSLYYPSSSLKGVLSTPLSLQCAVVCTNVLARASVLDTWKSNNDNEGTSSIPTALFAILEHVAGTRTCGTETLYRQLAVSSREAEWMSHGPSRVALETELVQTLDTVLLLSSTTSDAADDFTTTTITNSLLRWILFARALLHGVPEKGEDDDGVGVEQVGGKNGPIAAAKAKSQQDALPVFECATPSRWQVKCIAARVSATAMKELLAIPNLQPQHVDPRLAELAIRRRQQQQQSSHDSYLVFHLSEVLSAASGTVVATIDQYEMRTTQECGVYFLEQLLLAFGHVRDPHEPEVSILEQYSSQILSSIKHAMSSAGGAGAQEEEASYTMFVAGCQVLETAIKQGLIHDLMAFKRMVRPLIPNKTEEWKCCTFDDFPNHLRFKQGEGDNNNDNNNKKKERAAAAQDKRQLLLPRICKVATLARLEYLMDSPNDEEGVEIIKKDSAAFLTNETKPMLPMLATQAAAIAMDGVLFCRLNNNKSRATSNEQEAENPLEVVAPMMASMMFANVQDADYYTKAMLAKSWAVCGCYAAIVFSRLFASEDDQQVRDGYKTWLYKITPLLLSGFVKMANVLSSSSTSSNSRNLSRGFARAEMPKETCAFCLRGLVAIVKARLLPEEAMTELPFIITTAADTILKPALKSDGKAKGGAEPLIGEATSMLEELAGSDHLSPEVQKAVLVAVLQPLDALQKGAVDVSAEVPAKLIASNLLVAKTLVSKPTGDEAFVRSMMKLSLDTLSASNMSDAVRHAAEALLTACFETKAVPPSKQHAIASGMVKQEKWDTWVGICSRSKDALAHSLGAVREALSDLGNSNRHTGALSACQTMLRSASAETAGMMMQGVGPEVMGLFAFYGTTTPSPQRTNVCADCIKIMMVSYNHLVATGDETKLTPFVGICMEAWIGLIQYNGLPNQTSPQPHADPALGRMGAQAIVRVARTSPVAFKSSMAVLEDRQRAILEFAVRAEMSGYASSSSAPQQPKTLNIKSFQRS